jgi:hypothetical protein
VLTILFAFQQLLFQPLLVRFFDLIDLLG